MGEASAPAHRLVRFGVFELDLRSGELRKSGARLNLQQQPLQLLSVLLEQPGELVTREELRKRLWPDDTFVDFEHGLNAAVKRLRDTLGDSADSPRFVETVPRRGYRFIAPAIVPDGPATTPGRGAGRWHLRWPWVIAGIGAAGAIVLGIWALLKTPAQENGGANTTSAHRSTGAVNQLTTGTDLNTEPTVSPDGEWVAYASDRSGEGHLDIWLQRLSGGEPLQLTRDAADEREPTFSPMGPASHSIPGAREAASTSSPLTAMARPNFSSPAARMDHGSRLTDAGSRIRQDRGSSARTKARAPLATPTSSRQLEASRSACCPTSCRSRGRSGLPTVVTSSSLPDARSMRIRNGGLWRRTAWRR